MQAAADGNQRPGAPRRDWASLILVGCAITVTFFVAAREIEAWLHPPGVHDQVGMKPVYVKNWKSLTAPGEWIGAVTAPVVIAEFGDLECPICRHFRNSVDSVRKKYGDRVALLYVHFPLAQIHSQAAAAAQAAECAGSQGRFVAFYDAAYAKQDSLGKKPWSSYAQDAGVPNLPQFDRCVADTTMMPRVRLGLQAGKALGVTGTPTVLVNGWKYSGALSPDRLDSAVAMALRGKTPPDWSRATRQ